MCIGGGGFFSRSIKTGRNLGLGWDGWTAAGMAALIRTRTTQHRTMPGFRAKEREREMEGRGLRTSVKCFNFPLPPDCQMYDGCQPMSGTFSLLQSADIIYIWKPSKKELAEFGSRFMNPPMFHGLNRFGERMNRMDAEQKSPSRCCFCCLTLPVIHRVVCVLS